MKCVVKIGYTEILLPSTTGVERMLSLLAKGVEVSREYSGSYREPDRFILGAPIRVGMEMVPPGSVTEKAPPREAAAEVQPTGLRASGPRQDLVRQARRILDIETACGHAPGAKSKTVEN